MSIVITLHNSTPADAVKRVQQVAYEFDRDAVVENNYGTKSLEVVLTTFILMPIVAYISAYAKRRGERKADEHADLSELRRGVNLVDGVRQALAQDTTIVLRDTEDVGLDIILRPTDPADVLLALPEDPSAIASRSERLVWDVENQQWIDPWPPA